MPANLFIAVFFTVTLMLTTVYFLLGSLPLLTLKHDTPLDARFVRGFYNTYYLAVMLTASATALSFGFAGWWAVALGAAALALLAAIQRRKVIPAMALLGSRIQAGEAHAVAAFRRMHLAAIGLNLAQLVAIVWCLVAISVAMR